MQQMAVLNEIQVNILRRLRMIPFGEHLRFAEINSGGVPSDRFSYHLRQLLRNGLIINNADGAYSLTTVGRSEAPLIAPHDSRIAKQSYVTTRIILAKEEGESKNASYRSDPLIHNTVCEQNPAGRSRMAQVLTRLLSTTLYAKANEPFM